jgi:hypothetical protein
LFYAGESAGGLDTIELYVHRAWKPDNPGHAECETKGQEVFQAKAAQSRQVRQGKV